MRLSRSRAAEIGGLRVDKDQGRYAARYVFYLGRANEGMAIMIAPMARERQPIYISEMMGRLGIESGGGVAPHLGLRYAIALYRCKACLSKQPCRDWLDSMPASVTFAPRFCPNAEIFFELQADQPGAHRL